MHHFTIHKDGVRFNSAFDGLQGNDSKVCIISLIGKSRLDRFHMKSGIFNNFIKTDIFNADNVDTKCNCYIEGYYHKTDNVLLLHLVSRSDSMFRMELYKRWLKEDSVKDHGEYLREANHDYMRALMFILSVSHVILINEPGSSFDISYIRLFKQLEILRNKLHTRITELLETLDLPKSWVVQARPCIPRLLFIFESCLLSTDVNDDADLSELEAISKARSKKMIALRELQHAIGEMIYKVFRKERIVSNTSTNSLLSISSNQDFVYILSEDELSNVLFDPTQYYSGLLSEACTWPESSEDAMPSGEPSTKPARYSSLRSSTTHQPLNPPQQPPSPPSIDGDLPTLQSSRVRSEEDDLRNFLKQHVDVVLNKKANSDRVSAESNYELISVKTFLKMAEFLHTLFFSDDVSDPDVLKTFHHFFEEHVDIDLKFSETQCAKVFVQSMSIYQKDLPDFYSKKMHLDKVNGSKQYFVLHSRGPSVQKFIKKLEKECLKIWKDGRRSCERISMKGNPCCNELHRSHENLNELSYLPFLEHDSNIMVRSTCNCGRSQDERVDPFTHKSANFEFFQDLEKRCCSNLEHHHFSVHVPSSVHTRPVQGAPSSKSLSTIPHLGKSSELLSLTQNEGSKYSERSTSNEETRISKPETPPSEEDSKVKDQTLMGFDCLKFDKLSLPTVSSPHEFGTGDSHEFKSSSSRLHKFTRTDEDDVDYDDDDLNPYKRNLKDGDDDDDDNRHYKLSQGNDDDDDDDVIDDDDNDYGKYNHMHPKDYFKDDDDEDDNGGDNYDEEHKSICQTAGDGDRDDVDGVDDEQNANHHGNDDTINANKDDEVDTRNSYNDDDDDDETRDDTSVDVTAATDRTSDGDGSDDEFEGEDGNATIVCDTMLSDHHAHGHLVGMLNSESPKGSLPLFSSWSLVRLGKYASYEASLGIDHPGFTHQSNFLLPVDIKLQPDSHDSWSTKSYKGRVLRLYIGLEYECSKSHRFLLCSPTKMLKVTPGLPMKETGSKVVNSDMPLYFPCSCRSNASQMGQLMRIHVAVPDCDLEVKLKVKVQPGPSPCPIFFPEGGESITLRTGLWVLRLPYVYFDGSKSYLMPNEQKVNSCRLLKGCLTVLEKRSTHVDA